MCVRKSAEKRPRLEVAGRDRPSREQSGFPNRRIGSKPALKPCMTGGLCYARFGPSDQNGNFHLKFQVIHDRRQTAFQGPLEDIAYNTLTYCLRTDAAAT